MGKPVVTRQHHRALAQYARRPLSELIPTTFKTTSPRIFLVKHRNIYHFPKILGMFDFQAMILLKDCMPCFCSKVWSIWTSGLVFRLPGLFLETSRSFSLSFLSFCLCCRLQDSFSYLYSIAVVRCMSLPSRWRRHFLKPL